MNAAEVITRHEPEPNWTGEGFEGFECAWCSPRDLLVFPLADWTAFADHLARALDDEVTP